MSDRYATAEEFLAAHSEFDENLDELDEELLTEEDSTPKPKKSAKDWAETQKARSQYLKEWEEDMRYAQELASEGM